MVNIFACEHPEGSTQPLLLCTQFQHVDINKISYAAKMKPNLNQNLVIIRLFIKKWAMSSQPKHQNRIIFHIYFA